MTHRKASDPRAAAASRLSQASRVAQLRSGLTLATAGWRQKCGGVKDGRLRRAQTTYHREGCNIYLASGTYTESTHEAPVPIPTGHLDLEAQTPHACQVLLHERFALFVGLGPIEFEETTVARRFCLGTSTTTTIRRNSR